MIYKVCAYTTNEYYRKLSERLEKSLTKFGLTYHIERIQHPGTWHKAVSLKPAFIRKMVEETTLEGVLYLDADAEVVEPLDFRFFDKYDISFLEFERAPISHSGIEFLTGTMLFRKNEQTLALLKDWEEKTKLFGISPTPEQDSMKMIFQERKHQDVKWVNLDPSWVYIYDDWPKIYKDLKPSIIHYQASRDYRKQERDHVAS